MRIYLTFMLLLSMAFPGFAQEKSSSLPYPDLIPVLVNDSMYGYCDKDLNLKIDPKFEHAGLFEEDFSFQVLHVNNPGIVHYGTSAYAWVKMNGERYRINKKGAPVYKYNAQDFKTGETAIHLFDKPAEHIVDSVDEKTLFQYVKDKRTGRQVFPNEQFLNDLKEKNKDLVAEGIILVYYPEFVEQPFTHFTSKETFLQGIKNTRTGKITIKARYAFIEECYNNSLRMHQYPLFVGYRGDLDKSVYVGLDGTEYVISK